MRQHGGLITAAHSHRKRRRGVNPGGLVLLAAAAALVLWAPLQALVGDAGAGAGAGGGARTRTDGPSEAELAAVKRALMAADEYVCDANQTASLPTRVRPPPAACRQRWYVREGGGGGGGARANLPAAELIVAVPVGGCWAAAIRTVAVAVVRSSSTALPRVWVASTEAAPEGVQAALGHLPRVQLMQVVGAEGVESLRQAAAQRVAAPVTAFLSAGVLPHAGWLEPLVAELAEDGFKGRRPTVALPAVPPRRLGAPPPTVGHDWALRRMPFGRGHMSGFAREMLRALSPLLPHGDFAVSTAFWRRVGGYGEFGGATELALRVWACGGAVATVPCSRIAAPRSASLRSLEREERIAVAFKWFGPYAMLSAFANGYEPNSTMSRADAETPRCGGGGGASADATGSASASVSAGGFSAYMGAAFPEMQSSAQIMLGHDPWRGPRAWGRLRLWGTRQCVSYSSHRFETARCEDASVMMLSRLGYLMAAPRLTATCVTRKDDVGAGAGAVLYSKRCDVFYYGVQNWEIEPKRETAVFARIDGEPHCLTSMPGNKLRVAACLPMRAARQSWIWEYRASDDAAGNDLGEQNDEPVEGVQR